MADSCYIPFTNFDFDPQIDCSHPIRWSPKFELGPYGDPYFKSISFPQICPEKKCVVFGNHDAFPAVPRCEPSPKRDPPNVNSLGAAVGLLHSSYKMSTAETEIEVLQPQRFATIIKTMAEIYIKPITEWTTETLDAVIQEGQKLFMESNNDPAIDQKNFSIYNQFENTIRREFDYESMTFRFELYRKYYLNEHRAIHVSEGTSSSNISLDELFETLKSFYLRDGIYGLLMLEDWYLMIWRQQGIYFIADYYGRRTTDFRSDREDGYAMVISLKSIENVIHLILNLSDLEKDTTFTLREMRLVRLTTTDGRTQTRDYLSRKNEYKVINDDYAYLKALLHLSLNPNDPLRNRSALPTAVATLLAAKIDAPGTWTGKQLDNLMCYGLSFCRCCWTSCLDNVHPIHIEDFPRELKLGQFFVKFYLHTRILSGRWLCVPCYKNSELSTAIEELFEAGHNKLIIQIDHQIYSVWSKNGFIYLFDPFRHRVQGDEDPNNIDEKSASLRVFRSLDLFLNVFNMILCEMTLTSKFYIHSLKILEIAARDAQKKWVVSEYSKEMDDIMSLNEYICYEEDEKRCEELAEISDYGDDDQDVPSELPSSPSSSTIGEEMEEEGEGRYGNIAGVESSSSHEDIHQKKKQKPGSKHGDMETSNKKVRIYDASKKSFFPFDDKTSSHDTTRKESKNKRKRGKPPSDQVGDTVKESVDEPSSKSKKKRSSKQMEKSSGDQVGDTIREYIDKPSGKSRRKQPPKKRGMSLGDQTGDTMKESVDEPTGKSRKKRSPKKRGMPLGDQTGDTLNEAADEPSRISRKKQSSKTETGYDSDDRKDIDLDGKKDNVPKSKKRTKRTSKADTTSDSDGRKDPDSDNRKNDVPKSKKRRKRSSKAGTGSDTDGLKDTAPKSNRLLDDEYSWKDIEKSQKYQGEKTTDVSIKDIGQGGDKGTKKNIQRETGEEGAKEFDEKKEGSDADTRRRKEAKKEQGKDTMKDQGKEGAKKNIKEVSKNSDLEGDTKRKRQDEQNVEKQGGKDTGKVADKEKVTQGKTKDGEQGKQSGQETEREDRGRRESKTDKGRQESKEQPKVDQPTAKGEKVELGKQKLEREKQTRETNEKSKMYDRDIVDKPDFALKQTSSLNIPERDQENAQKKLLETIRESKIYDGSKVKKGQTDDGPTHTEVKTKTDEQHKEMKKKQDDKQHKITVDQVKRERYKRKLDRMMMDEKTERKVYKNIISHLRDDSMDRQFNEEPEERKQETFIYTEEDKVERPQRASLLLIEKERKEIEQIKNQLEKSRQNKKTAQSKKRLTNLSKKDRFSSVESFKASYGELILDKNENVDNYEERTGLDKTDTEIKQDSPSEKVKKRKGKKGQRKKGVKKETEIICDFEPSNFAIEGWNKEKKICRRQNVNEICCSVLTKQICNRQKVEKRMDDEHIQLASSRDGRYPGFNECPTDLMTIRSRSCSYNSLLRLFRTAFQSTDRVLVQTPWNNFVVFRYFNKHEKAYYIYSGCTCNLNRFRHMDLSYGTAGLCLLSTIHDVITTIKFYRKPKRQTEKERNEKIEILLQQYGNC